MKRIDRMFEWTGKIFLLSYFIFVLIAWMSYRESFRIDSINVSGTHVANDDDIQLLAAQFLSQKILWKIDKNNAVFYPREKLSLALYSLDSHIKHVDMQVKNKKNLSIYVTEYSPRYIWCGENTAITGTTTNDCYLADTEGFIYAKSPTYSGFPFPVFRTNLASGNEQGTPIGLYVLTTFEFNKIAVMMDELKKNDIFVSQILQTDEFDYTFITDKSWVLLWSSTKDPIKSVENLKLVLADIIRRSESSTKPVSIDLRFGNKIFYK